MIIRLFYFCLYILLSFPANSFALYVYQDENGNKVFSDIPPAKGEFKERAQLEINTLKWQETPQINHYKRKSNRKNSQKQTDKKKNKKANCAKLASKIELHQNRLRTKQSPAQFDKNKQALVKLRWKYRKSC
ncbi:DUF4124 domain-containing protein [Aliikangiella coralliicola]|uniref:DUF4124 domain-containing protein n=1 Tax=Aliikangiella coralliicola TaxID=2592383 RepID=A0A545U4T8_9GAMM|nr:DUF4124 domain-containing protein [Aliikangiella coralliicola]TQV84486.1 DUF4124 domain-containing protein [Aliikangiella coralliicola]